MTEDQLEKISNSQLSKLRPKEISVAEMAKKVGNL